MSSWSDLRAAARAVARVSREELWFSTRAWLLAAPIECALAVLGAPRTLRALALVRRPALLGRSRRAVDVDAGVACVSRAYALHVVTGQCLPRASVQHAIHRLDGTPSRLVIGVRRPTAGGSAPLEAHAWVAAPTGPLDRDFTALLVLDDTGVHEAVDAQETSG